MPNDIFRGDVARRYDATARAMFEPAVLDPTIDTLVGLAAGRRVLEFAIGTGRVALPLSERGVDVSGVELSADMIGELQAKPGADRIPVVRGDMASIRVTGEFGLVYLVYNTISNLLTQDDQVACFHNAATHLAPGGHFVIEDTVPQLRRLPPGETLVPFDASPTHVGVDEYDVVAQRLVSHHYWVRDAHTFTSTHRYAWPSELDLMARLAGMELVERWGNWDRSPFTADSISHVSVWEKPDT